MARRGRWLRLVGSLAVAATLLAACTAPTGSVTPGTHGGASTLAGFVPQSVVRIEGAGVVVVAGSIPCGGRVCASLSGGGRRSPPGPSSAAQGHEVLVNFDPPVSGGQPHLLIARDGRRPFTTDLVARLESAGACDLSPQPGGAVWSACPTGMLVSYLHAPRAAGPYRPVWDYAGTGGGGLVAVTARIAYRYTGIAAGGPATVPADALQRSTDAGRSFADAGPWPFAHRAGTAPAFVFLNERDGFGIGPAPTATRTPEVVETADAGRHWERALP